MLSRFAFLMFFGIDLEKFPGIRVAIENCATIYRDPKEEELMKILNNENGKVGWILLWALGVPIPVLLILFMMRGCT